MRAVKKLELNRQTLRELTPQDLKVAAGAAPAINPQSIPVAQCFVLPTAQSECIPLQ
jgi:hypothetical protein